MSEKVKKKTDLATELDVRMGELEKNWVFEWASPLGLGRRQLEKARFDPGDNRSLLRQWN